MERPILDFAVTSIWGLIVFASWIGWGRLAAQAFHARTRVQIDIGIRAGWGMCAMIFVGGVLNATALCSPWIIAVLTLLGTAIAAAELFSSTDKICSAIQNWRERARGWLPYALLIGLVAILYFGSACWRASFNPNDDPMAYFVFPLKMLQTGAVIEPFSLRRLVTLGGYSFLQATTMAVGRRENFFLLDVGLAGILNCLLIVPYLRRNSCSPWMSTLAAIICLTFPLDRINSACCGMGLAGFILLFRTLDLIWQNESNARLLLRCMAGAGVAAIAALRLNLLPFAGSALLFSELLWAMAGTSKWRLIPLNLALAGIAAMVFILPWSISLHAASGSYLYPLFKGNLREHLEWYSAHLDVAASLKHAAGFFLKKKPLLTLTVGSMSLCLRRPHIAAFWLAAILVTFAILYHSTFFDYGNILRYVTPAMIAAVILVCIGAQMPTAPGSIRCAGAIVMVGIAASAAVHAAVSQDGDLRLAVTSLRSDLIDGQPFVSGDLAAAYADVQAQVPHGSTVLTMAEYDFLFDFHRNVVFSVDWPTVCSPPPRYPFFKGPQALKDYLLGQRIRYLICEHFDASACLFRREWYDQTSPNAVNDGWMRLSSPYVLDLMANIDELAATATIYDQHGLRVIELR